ALSGLDQTVLRALVTWQNAHLAGYEALWFALDAFSWAASLVLSAEFTILIAGLLTLYLGRSGAGFWSVVPFAVVPLTAIEITLKALVAQPPIYRVLGPIEFAHFFAPL